MGFDAWQLGGVGGAAALTYIAAGSKIKDSRETSLRLSIDPNKSLLGDVRVLGGGLAWLASMYTSGDTKKALQTIAWASGISVLLTEVMRWQLSRQGGTQVRAQLPIFPSFGGMQGQGARQYQPQGNWANR